MLQRIRGVNAGEGGALSMIARGDDLTTLYGVGKKRATLLESLGIRDYEDLLDCDLEALALEASCYDTSLSIATLEGLRFHVRSYLTDRPPLFDRLPEIGATYLAFDLEYDSLRLIWLIGVLVVEGDRQRHQFLWAGDAEMEARNLESLGRFLRRWSPRPLLTWAGRSADLPQLRRAADRHGLARTFKGGFAGHIDLFVHCERSLRLPIPSLGLDRVSSFFGFEGESSIENGLEAMRRFDSYRESRDPEVRARLRSDLIVYNRDDLRALVAIEQALRHLAVGQESANNAVAANGP